MSIERSFDLIINAGTSSPLVINANQNDSGEIWKFNLYQEDGTKVIPAAGEIVGLKSDGHAIVNAGTVNESGQVVITETAQITAAVGANVFEIVFDSVHGTANFILYVEKSPVDDDADFSESDISAINQAIAMAIDAQTVAALQNGLQNEAQTRYEQDALLAGGIAGEAATRAAADAVLRQAIDDAAIVPAGSTVVVDNTLSIAGAAADAKKTGDAVSDLNDYLNTSFILKNWNLCKNDGIELLENTFINGETVTSGQALFFSFRYIPVEAGKKYQFYSSPDYTEARFVNYYNSEKVYQSQETFKSEVTIPSGISFISVTFWYDTPVSTTEPGTKGAYYVKEKNVTVNTLDFEGNLLSNSPTLSQINEDIQDAKNEVYEIIDITPWNLCDNDELEVLEQTYINGTSVVDGQGAFFSIRYIPVEAMTNYACHSGAENKKYARFVNYYDSTKTYLSQSTFAANFTTPENTAFVSVTFDYENTSTQEKGNYYVKLSTSPLNNVISFKNGKIGTESIYDFRNAVSEVTGMNYATSEHRCAVINFQFDDNNAKDADIVNIFKGKNAVCGFAVISNISSRIGDYLGYQNEGFEILSHSTDGEGMNDPTVSPSTIETKLKNSKKVLEGYGFKIRGWVTPNSTMAEIFRPLLKKYYDFGYTVYFGEYSGSGTPYFTKMASTYNLSRVSVQSTTLANMKAAVDTAIENNGFLTFYGHAAALDGTDYETTENLESLLDYINEKKADLQCKLLKPSDAVDFYFHVRHEDYLELLNG